MPKRILKASVAVTLRRKRSRRLITFLLTLAGAGGIVFLLGWLGSLARDSLGPRERYRMAFSQIECDTPPALDHARFLSEVRYAGNAPESFQLLDPELSAKLKVVFAAHPWVEEVEAVEVERPARVTVRLRFRTPVLAIRVQPGSRRLVDGNGVLLPVADVPGGLPELVHQVPDAEIASGKVWPDPTVKRAIELVKTYHPRQLMLTHDGWKLTVADGSIVQIGN